DIQSALSSAAKGISQYSELMAMFPNSNVSTDAEFQRKFNAFYKVQRRQKLWYEKYYTLMQQQKDGKPNFADVLDEIYSLTGRYEPSFVSKLVATIDPSKPIWDQHVFANTGHRAPSYSSKKKFIQAKDAYVSVENWYRVFLESDDGQLCISEFDKFAPEHRGITALKKVDFILWQMRSKRKKVST
ncbi:MAG: hypothetical protein RL748_3292, partial [Pseudomonadota bacterium]